MHEQSPPVKPQMPERVGHDEDNNTRHREEGIKPDVASSSRIMYVFHVIPIKQIKFYLLRDGVFLFADVILRIAEVVERALDDAFLA